MFRLCLLAFHTFYSNSENGSKTRQVSLKNKYSRQKVAVKKARTCKETVFSSDVKQASATDFYRSVESPETFGSLKKTFESKERLQTTAESGNQQILTIITNTKERSPRLITKQWVRQEIIWKVHRDIKEDDASFHENSAAKCQTDTGGQQEKQDISTLDLDDHGTEESGWHPRQQKAFGCNLREDTDKYESKEEERCSSGVCPVSYFDDISCKSTTENTNGLKEASPSILASDRSTVSEEQCYSSANPPANPPAATGAPAKHCAVSTPLEGRGAQISKFPSLEHLDTVGIAPACVAKTPNCANAKRVAQEETSQIELLNTRLESLFRDKHNKDTEVTRSAPHQSQGTLGVRNAKMEEQSGKFNAQHYPENQNESQNRVKAKNFWSKHRVNDGKRFRFRFISLRSVLRNNEMPHM